LPKVVRKGSGVLVDGLRSFLLGVNYWSRENNIQMWSRWDLRAVQEDLDLVKKFGIRCLRVFILATDFATGEGDVKEVSLQRFRTFLDEAAKRGVIVFPSLIVGHMSGKNWFIPWDPSNDIYSREALEKSKKFVRKIVGSFKDHPAIGGWILSNEISHVRSPPSVEDFRAWVKELVEAIKELDEVHMVSIGDSTSPRSRLPLRPENVFDLVDYLSPHIYYYDDDEVRHTYYYMMELEYLRSLGVPVILEEYGFPTNLYEEDSHSRFIELILYGALALGVQGAWVWCFSDFPREEDEPYLWEPHELSFGIVRANGTPKPAASSIKKFAGFLEYFEKKDYRLAERDSAILVPSHFYRRYEFHNFPYQHIRGALLMAYILAKASGLNPTFLREEELRGNSDYGLIIIPSISRLLTRSWRLLLEKARRGTVVYYSHVRYPSYPHMSACHIWDELFGIKPVLKAGMRATYIPSKFTLVFEDGSTLEYDNPLGDIATTGFSPIDSKVLATDSEGTPILFKAERGKGKVLFSSYPLELILFSNLKVRWEQGYELVYSILMKEARITPLFRSSNPMVQLEYLIGSKGYLLFLLNHSYNDSFVEVGLRKRLTVSRTWNLKTLEQHTDKLTVKLAPKTCGIVELEC